MKGDTIEDQAATANTGGGGDDGSDGETKTPAAVRGQSTAMRGTAHPTGRDKHENGGGVVDGVGVLDEVLDDDSVGSEESVDATDNVRLGWGDADVEVD